jgi:hypothetical protein
LGRQANEEEIKVGQEKTKRDDHPVKSYAHVEPKRRDYHAMLYTVLDSLRLAQKKGGLLWRFTYAGLEKRDILLLKTPVLFVMGDTEGHNKLCGLVGGGNKNPLCRYCNCKRDDTNNPRAKTTHTCTSSLKQWMTQGERGRKKVRVELGYYCLLHNGFDEIDFCDHERGD